MPRYRYSAYDQRGALTQGVVETRTRELALNLLHQQGRHPLEVVEDQGTLQLRWWEREVFGSGQMSVAGLALLTRELATLVKADLPLDETLRIVSAQPLLPAKVRRTALGVLEAVLGGATLSGAMAARGSEFPEYYWRLIQAGESSGTLGDVLEDISTFLERSSEVRSQVASALLYPAVLLLAAIAALTIIMTVLLPVVVPLFKDAGAQPPPTLQFLVMVQDGIASYWPVALLGLAGLAAAVVALLRNAQFRVKLDSALLKLPIVGRLISARETARFSRTLGTLTRNGVPLLDAVRISSRVMQNHAFAHAIGIAEERLKEGASLSAPLLASGLFSELSLRLIAVGEQTGQLDTMLARLATIYEAALQRQITRLMSLLTPVLTVLIGGMVGGLILSVMNAILSVNDLAFQ